MTGFRHRLLATIGLIGALALGGCGYYGQTGYYQPGAFGGWYNNFYYPGNGYYVYDRGGRRHRWNDGQRRYWEGRRVERRDDRWRGRDRDRRADGRRDWRGRDNDGRGEWRGRGNDGRPGNGTYTRPRPQPGVEGDRGRGRWQGNNAVRPTPQARPTRPARPQASQPRPQRNMSTRPAPSIRADRPSRTNSRGPAVRTQPN